MNMINVRRLTVMTFLGAGMLSGISAQVSPLQVDTLKENDEVLDEVVVVGYAVGSKRTVSSG